MLNKAVIDLKILQNNALNIKKILGNKTKFCAVVKSDAYGHGGTVIANALYNIVDCFAVALLEEGISLRLGGIDKDILLLIEPFKKDIQKAVFYSLTVTVTSIKTIKRLEYECRKQNKKMKIHIKYETGMNRQGVRNINELVSILEYVKKSKYVYLDGFYSHFSNITSDKKTLKAIDKFLLANKVVKGYNINVISHISASGGFLKGYLFDMVRIGILLYGYKPFKSNLINVKPIMKVISPVINTITLKKGESCLYSGKPIKKPVKRSLIRFGYADGLDRACIIGQINNRCMDVSAVKTKREKRFITVLDNAEVLARKYHTIPYEILTKVSIRAEKIYKR